MELFDRYTAKRVMGIRNISGKELAEKIGVHPKDVSRWMRGCVNPREDKIRKIANALDVCTRTLTIFIPNEMGGINALQYFPTEMLLDELKARMLNEEKEEMK